MRLRTMCVTLLFMALSIAGGTPGNAQQTTPQRLTLKAAIGLALKQNLSVLVANTQVEELAGTRARRLVHSAIS